jgi:hypothetical protein
VKVAVHPWVYLAVAHVRNSRPWLEVSADQIYTPPRELLASMLRYAVRLPLPIGSERALQQAVILLEDRSPPRRLGGPAERRVVKGEVERVLAAAELCIERRDYPGENAEAFREFLQWYAILSLWNPTHGFMADALEYALRPE